MPKKIILGLACLAAAFAACQYAAAQAKKEEQPAPAPASNVKSIAFDPAPQILEVGKPFQIKIVATLADGSALDITSKAKIKQSNKLRRGGDKITPSAPGFHWISAGFERKFATIPILAKNPEAPAAAKKAKDKKPAPKKEKSASKIDELINENLAACNVFPSEICSDHEFLRRLYLDATGLLPDPKTAEAFLKSADKNKRAKLVEEVLNTPQFLDMLTMRLADILRIKSEFPSNLWPNAAQAYHTWIRDSLQNGTPYDILAREMLLSSGSNFKNPPVNFYRAVNDKKPENYAEAAALVFMGVRTNCVKCHDHRDEAWTMQDGKNFAKIFGCISMKKSKEWKEEILTLEIPEAPQEFFIFGEKISSEPGKDPREAFVKWLVDEKNPYFAKIAVNRVWHWIFGSGLTDPADDLRPNRLSSNPKLEKYLQEVFAKSGYDLKALYREIFLSQTYARSSAKNDTNKNEETLFSRHYPKRLDAESLNDIVSGILGVYQPFKSITPEPYAFWPDDFKAIQLHDGSVSNPFLTLFGKPGRNSSHLNDRSNNLSMQQLLHLLGSSNINSKLDNSQFLKDLARQPVPPAEKIKTLYLAFLSRNPTKAELDISRKYFESKAKTTHDALKDLAWAIINTKEFLFKL